MTTLMCGNRNCKYLNGGGVCTKEFVFLNQYGACSHWWTKEGQFRGGMFEYAEVPDNVYKAEPMEASDQPSPHQ